jgi:hypothetical protein
MQRCSGSVRYPLSPATAPARSACNSAAFQALHPCHCRHSVARPACFIKPTPAGRHASIQLAYGQGRNLLSASPSHFPGERVVMQFSPHALLLTRQHDPTCPVTSNSLLHGKTNAMRPA